MLWVTLAFAQSSADCDSVYSNDDFKTSVNEVDRLMEKADLDRSITVLRKTENLLPCMEELVDIETLGMFARHYSLVSFLQQDGEQAVRWGHVMAQVTPEMDYGDAPAGGPITNMVANQPLEEADPGGGWAHEKKGAAFVNGSFSPLPTTQSGMPYLVQMFSGKGFLTRATWQDGAVYADGYVDASGPTEAPKFFDPATRIITPKGKAPSAGKAKKFPVIPTAAAGGLLVASGVLYALAGVTKAKLTCGVPDGDSCTEKTSQELTGLRSRANLFVMGSGVALIGGVGIGVSGLLVSDEAPMINFSGRF